MEISRSKQQYIIMTVIYDELNDFIVGGGKTFRDARELISELCEQPYETVDPFIQNMIASSLNNYGDIKAAFEPLLTNWKWERIPLLTQSILLMSYAHYYYVEKVDKRVVINTAVELTKKYVEEKQAKFVNAILDGVIK